MEPIIRLTVAQALVRFLAAQHTERDGVRRRLIAGCLGIFGHGNVAGIGQALSQEAAAMPYYPSRNEQAMVHVAAGYARQCNRLTTLACTTSVGPGATNLVTGAALATINRLPVLLLPGDTFATRRPHPVLQQLEVDSDATISVNDCLRPVSRYFDRITRPEQLIRSALEAMRVLTDPAQTGAVTLALPEDVQTEIIEAPAGWLDERVWIVHRQPAARDALTRASNLIRSARRPLIVAGGGVIYSEATGALQALAAGSGIPVAETQAGRGALVSAHPLSLGAVGATGTAAANALAREADLVLGVGTRWSDFTTASNSAFQDPDVRFINVNVCAMDAGKQAGLAVLGDAREVLEALADALGAWRAPEGWTARAQEASEAWGNEVAHLVGARPANGAALTQAAIIGAVNDAAGETGVVVCAAGSAPGDLHKLWRARDPAGKGYHVEYGYSCMGYEIPGGMGVKLGAPERRVLVLIGDGSYLMLPGELVTAVAERIALTIVLVDNHGYASIGALSRSVGSAGFGTHHRYAVDGRPPVDVIDPGGGAPGAPAGSDVLPVDLAANAASLGARVVRAATLDELRALLAEAADADGPVVIAVSADRYAGVPSYGGWWDVPVAAVSEQPSVQAARTAYEHDRRAQRDYVAPIDAARCATPAPAPPPKVKGDDV